MYAFVFGDSEFDEEGQEGGTFSRAHETILSTLSCPNLFVRLHREEIITVIWLIQFKGGKELSIFI